MERKPFKINQNNIMSGGNRVLTHDPFKLKLVLLFMLLSQLGKHAR